MMTWKCVTEQNCVILSMKSMGGRENFVVVGVWLSIVLLSIVLVECRGAQGDVAIQVSVYYLGT